MSKAPDHHDVDLILRLYELRRERKMREARAWFSESFKVKNLKELNQLCPSGSQTNAYFRMVASYWDMVASFIRHETLNKQLFFESGGEMLLVWVRIEPLLEEIRQQFSDANFLGNLEEVAGKFIRWREKRSPGSFEAFKKRVG
ncbi:MAG TPA: hypothetical protein VLU25_09540 [Acidobacteriota bacterium]|nr:hypothetical protein [Acidobacteriota bacterium]